jgi:hypothetical protein
MSKIVAQEVMFAGVQDMDPLTLVTMACELLKQAGFQGAYSGDVISALERRVDILGAQKATVERFLSEVLALCQISPGTATINGRVTSVRALLGNLQTMNGEAVRHG